MVSGSGRCVAGLIWRYGGVAARRRALVVCGVLIDGAEGQQRGRLDGTGGKVSGRASEALMAGQYSPGWRNELRQAAVMPCSSLRSGSSEAEQRREKGGRERERVDFDFSQNFQWKLEKV